MTGPASLPMIWAQEKIAEPERRAIHDENAVVARFPAQCRRKRHGLFDESPFGAAVSGVPGDALRHLFVMRLRCRDQNRQAAGGFRDPLRIAALARSGAAQDEKAALARCGILHVEADPE